VRRAIDRSVRTLAALCAGGTLALTLGIGGYVIVRGAPALVTLLSGLFDEYSSIGESVVFPLVGTLILLATTAAIALPLAAGTALLHSVYLPSGAWRRRLRLTLYALNSVPSIVFGVFGFLLFCQRFGWGKSWLAGGIVLAFMILPTVTVAFVERIDALPKAQLDAAYGLGLTRHQVVTGVIVPQAAAGLVSGMLIGLARAVGETAPIMFTAAVFSGARIPTGVVESPVLALPYRIFVSAQDSLDPAAQGDLWSAALLLLLLAAGLGLASLPLRRVRDAGDGVGA